MSSRLTTLLATLFLGLVLVACGQPAAAGLPPTAVSPTVTPATPRAHAPIRPVPDPAAVAAGAPLRAILLAQIDAFEARCAATPAASPQSCYLRSVDTTGAPELAAYANWRQYIDTCTETSQSETGYVFLTIAIMFTPERLRFKEPLDAYVARSTWCGQPAAAVLPRTASPPATMMANDPPPTTAPPTVAPPTATAPATATPRGTAPIGLPPMPGFPGDFCYQVSRGTAVVGSGSAPATPGAAIAVTALVVAPAVDARGLPLGAKTDFARGEMVCIAYTLANINPDDTVEYRITRDGVAYPPDRQRSIYGRSLASDNRLIAFRQPPVGTYQIAIFLNDATTPSATTTFTVR